MNKQAADLVNRILDPLPVTGAAQVKNQSAVDLIHRFSFGEMLQLRDKSFNAGAQVGWIFAADERRRRIGNRFDRDPIQVALAGLQLGCAAGTEEDNRPGRFFWFSGQRNRTLSLQSVDQITCPNSQRRACKGTPSPADW